MISEEKQFCVIRDKAYSYSGWTVAVIVLASWLIFQTVIMNPAGIPKKLKVLQDTVDTNQQRLNSLRSEVEQLKEREE